MLIWIGLLLYGYREGGSALAAVIMLGQLLPGMLLSAPLGAIGDRLPPERALRGAYGVEALVLAALAVALAVGASLVLIILLAACITVVLNVGRSIHYATLTLLAPAPARLVRSFALSDLLKGIALFVGPVAAGLLFDQSGVWSVAAAAAVAMTLAVVLTVRLGLPGSPADFTQDEGLWASTAAGITVVTRDAGLRSLVLIVGLCFLCMGSLELLGVGFAEGVLNGDESTAGLVIGAVGVGSTLGAVLAASLAHRARLVPSIIGGLIIAGLPLIVMVVIGSLPTAVLALGICGAGISVSLVASRTLLQRAANPRVLTRVFAVQEAVTNAGLALGAIISPLLILRFGPGPAYLPLGIGVVLLTLLAWPAIRHLDLRELLHPDILVSLLRVPFLAAMSPPAVERLAREVAWRDVPAGTVIYREGERGDGFYLLGAGTLTSSVGLGGTPRAATLSKGEVFGDGSMYGDQRRSETVTSATDARVLRIDQDSFLTALTGRARGQAMAGLMSEDPMEVRIVAALTRNPQSIPALERSLGVEPESLVVLIADLVERGVLRPEVIYHPSFGRRRRGRSRALDDLLFESAPEEDGSGRAPE